MAIAQLSNDSITKSAMGPSPVIPRSKGLTRTIPIDAVVFLSWLSANCHLLPYPRSSAQIRGKGFSLSRSVSSVQISGEHCFSLSRRCRAISRSRRWAPPPSSQDLKDLHEPSQSTRLCSCLGYLLIAICSRIRVHPRKSAVKGFLSSDQCHQCKSVVRVAFPAMLCDHPMTAMGPSPVIPRSKGLTRTIPIDAVVFLSWLSANCHLQPYPRSSAQIRGKGFSFFRSVSSVQISGARCLSDPGTIATLPYSVSRSK